MTSSNPDLHSHCLLLFIFIDLAIPFTTPDFMLHFIFSTLDTLTTQASHTTWALLIDRAHDLDPPSSLKLRQTTNR